MKKNNGKKKNGISAGKVAAIGAGMAAVGAGAYYLLGPNSKKNQQKASALMTKMKKGAVSEIKKAKSVAIPFYKAHAREIKTLVKQLNSKGKVAKKKTVKK